MKGWIAKFIGGPLEGQEMQVRTTTVVHQAFFPEYNTVRTYTYIRYARKPHSLVWIYKIDEVTDEPSYVI